MRTAIAGLVVAALVAGGTAAPADEKAVDGKKSVVVPVVHAHLGVAKGTGEVLTNLLLEALLVRHGIRALGPPDVRAILSAEQQKILLGCQDESCFTELAGAMGADWLVAGSVGKLDDLYVLSLQLIDPRQAQVTSRTSATLKSLKEAPQAMGPLVDKLLGARPRVRVPAALADAGTAERKKAMGVGAHCKKARAYWKRLKRRPWGADLVSTRRELLEDLVATVFFKPFDRKTNCFWHGFGGTDNKLRMAWLRSKTEQEARDAHLRYLEAIAYLKQIELLEEAYPRGLEMEKNGTGRRLVALPFEVETAEVPVPENSEQVRSFRRAFDEAQKVVARMIEAAGAGDDEAVDAMFDPDADRARSRSYKQLRKWREQNFHLEACPFYIQSASEVESLAERMADKGVLRGCVRRSREQFCSTKRLGLKRIGGRWRIVDW